MSSSTLACASAEDAQNILALWRAAEAVHGGTDNIEDIQAIVDRDSAAFILALSSDQIVGSIIAAFDGWRGGIYRLAVHPDHRRRGLARMLVAEAEKVFKNWGVKPVSAIVLKGHPWAMGFWKAADYTVDERVVRFTDTPIPARSLLSKLRSSHAAALSALSLSVERRPLVRITYVWWSKTALR